MHICNNPVDAIAIVLKFFITEFVVHDQVNDEGGADPNGKTGHIYQGENLISPKISKRNEEVIFDHKSNEYVQIFNPCANNRTACKARLQPYFFSRGVRKRTVYVHFRTRECKGLKIQVALFHSLI
jgi:hypothetical protein